MVFGFGAFYSIKMNESLVSKLGTQCLDLLFGTSDPGQVTAFIKSFRENLISKKINLLISYLLIPFSTDLDLTIEQIQLIHVECAKKIDGLELLDAITLGSEYIASGAKILYEQGNITGLCMGDDQMSTLLLEYNSLLSQFTAWRANPGIDPIFVDEYTRCIDLEIRINDRLKEIKSKPLFQTFRQAVVSLIKMANTYLAQSSSGTYRATAFAVNIFGPSQIGKSTLMHYILDHAKNLDGLVEEQDLSVVVRGDEKYASHVRNTHKYLGIDDLCNTRSEFCQQSPLAFFLRAKNPIAIPIDQAEIELKGVINPEWKAICLTTNIADWGCEDYTICPPSMVLRAELHMSATVKPEFQNESGTLDNHKVRQVFKEGEVIDVWDITVYVVKVIAEPLDVKTEMGERLIRNDFLWCFEPMVYKGEQMANINIIKFLEIYGDLYKTHHEIQASIVRGAHNTDYEAIYCYTCNVSLEKCTCDICVQKGLSDLGQIGQYVMGTSNIYVKYRNKLAGFINHCVGTKMKNYNVQTLSVFGFDLSREDLYIRLEFVFKVILGILASTKLLHYLTWLPNSAFDMMGDVGQKSMIISFDTVSASSYALDRVAQSSICSLFTSLFTWKVLPIAGASLLGIATLDSFYPSWEKKFFDSMTNLNKQSKTLVGIKSLGSQILKLSGAVLTVSLVRGFLRLPTLQSTFCSLISALYFNAKLRNQYSLSIDEYTTKELEKIKSRRKYVQPHIDYLLSMTKKALTTVKQAGKDEFYVKEWEKFNKERFHDVPMAANEIMYCIKHNLVSIRDENGTESVQGIFLTTGRILIPAHYIRDKPFTAVCTRYDNPVIGNRRFIIAIDAHAAGPVPERDAVVLGTTEGGTFRNICNLFPTSVEPETASGSRYHKTKDGILMKSEVTSHNNETILYYLSSIVHNQRFFGMNGFSYGATNGQGLCGAPVISGKKKAYIKGIHIAGSRINKQLSYAIPILRGELDSALDSCMRSGLLSTPLEHVTTESMYGPLDKEAAKIQSPSVYIQSDKGFGYLGRYGGYCTSKNKVFQHVISEELEALGLPNKWGSPLPPKGQPQHGATDKWLDAATSQQKPIPSSLISIAAKDYVKPLIDIVTPSDIFILNRKQIVNGVPWLNLLGPLDMSTSTGFPYFKKKSSIATQTDDGSWVFPEYVWTELAALEATLLRGEMPRLPATCTGKMEVRVLGKGERKFQNVPLPITLLLRKVFGSLIAFLGANWRLSECVVGINPLGDDWDELAHWLGDLGDSNHTGDVKGFDQHIIIALFQALGMCYHDISKAAGMEPRFLALMKAVISMLCTPTVLVDGDVLELMCIMISGVVGTSFFDSGIISLLKRCHFYTLYKPIHVFRDYNRLVGYGDDSIESSTGCWRYNNISFAQYCATLGITITDANKGPVVLRTERLKQCSFLKRSFRYCNFRRRFVAPLEVDSLFKSLHNYVESSHISPDDVLVINIDNVIMELSLHTKPVFDKYVGLLRSLEAPIVRRAKFIDLDYEPAMLMFENRVQQDFGIPELLLDGKYKIINYNIHVQVQSGELKDIGSTALKENVVLHEQDDTHVVTYNHPSRDARADDDLELTKFFERPVIISTVTSLPRTTYTFDRINPWESLLDNARISNRLSNYALFSADIELTFLVTSSPFFYGQFMVSYFPTLGDAMYGFQTTFYESTLLSQLPHIIIDLSEEKSGTLTIPFLYNQEFLDLTALPALVGTHSNIGQVIINNITPIRIIGEDNAASFITIKVFARFKNVKVRGLTSTNISTIAIQSGELDEDGPVSKTASAVSTIAGIVSQVPIIGRYARATELIASGVGAVARIFGYSRPIKPLDKTQVIVAGASNMAVTNVQDSSRKLTVDVRQELTIDPVLSLQTTNKDPMAITTISTVPALVASFNWQTNQVEGYTIGYIMVDPAIAYMTLNHQQPGNTGLVLSPMGAASIPFSYWTGDLVYDIVVVCSRFHRGRLLIQYDPLKVATPVTPTEVNTRISYELDISTSKVHRVTIQPTQTTTYMETYLPNNILTATNLHMSGVSSPPFDHIGNGYLTFTILNNLSAPVTPTNTGACSILVWARTGDNFRVNKPNDFVKRLSPITLQSGNLDQEIGEPVGSGTIDSMVDLMYMGESIVSFRQLCKRYTLTFVDNNLQEGALHDMKVIRPAYPFYRGMGRTSIMPNETTGAAVPYNYTATTWYQYTSLMFAGTRGSIRYKIFPAIQYSYTGGWIGSAYWEPEGVHAYSNTTQDGNGTMDKRWTFQSSGHTGMEVVNATVNSVMEVEIPYQTNKIYSTVRSQTIAPEFNNLVYTGQSMFEGATGTDRFFGYSAAGEDYTVIFFRGLPMMTYETTFPVANN
jgi:hypothetical protein